MRLEKYIGDLLYRYQCVTVPEFGSFLTRYQSARVHRTTDAFYPPAKVISFNAQLTADDGLLTKHIAAVEKITYEEASASIAKESRIWIKKLQEEELLILDGIGEISTGPENKWLFQPSYQVNYLSSSFGLSTFVSPVITRETLKTEVRKLEERAPVHFTPERRESKSYLKYAAIFLVALSAGAAGFQWYTSQQATLQQQVAQEAQEQIEDRIQEATFFDTRPLELPAVTLELHKVHQPYHIVAGAYRLEANAEKRMDELRNKGFEAELIGINSYGLHQVAYASFSEVEEALQFLRKVKRTESKDAWLLVEK